MKKILPVVIVLIAVLIAVGAYLFVKNNRSNNKQAGEPNQEEIQPEIALEMRPVVSLMPSADGHWLKLEIKKILIDATTLDYEMTYKVPDGRTQGVPGTVKLTSKENIEKDLLLGSESSGKFRYDEGVQDGNLSLKFRDGNGKLVAKFETQFRLLTSEDEIISSNEEFSVKLTKLPTKTFFVVMSTIGYPGDVKLDDNTKLYGIFLSTKDKYSGTVEIKNTSNITFWDGSNWTSKFDRIGSGVYAGN